MSNNIYDFDEVNIEKYLERVFKCLENGKYTISQRDKNQKFMIRNNISSKKALEILKSLEPKDFCYAMRNDNIDPRFADEVLYLFCKENRA